MDLTQERTSPEAALRTGGFRTLLVHAEPGDRSTHRVEAAARLARDLGARLIGLGAETFDPIPAPDPLIGAGAPVWVAMAMEQVDQDLKAAEAGFRRDAAGADVEWRSVQDFPHRALIRNARAADLIVVGPRNRAGSSRSADPADVVMGAGRPVLMAPPGRSRLSGQAVLVAWKDTRECRRAVADALPFLRRAREVIVVAACKTDESDAAAQETGDVAAFLQRHGVDAQPLVTEVAPEAVSQELVRLARRHGADLIVAGAYGRSRLREWAFGGVTDDFMHRPDSFVLMSH